jgi:hypothetical protein
MECGKGITPLTPTTILPRSTDTAIVSYTVTNQALENLVDRVML